MYYSPGPMFLEFPDHTGISRNQRTLCTFLLILQERSAPRPVLFSSGGNIPVYTFLISLLSQFTHCLHSFAGLALQGLENYTLFTLFLVLPDVHFPCTFMILLSLLAAFLWISTGTGYPHFLGYSRDFHTFLGFLHIPPATGIRIRGSWQSCMVHSSPEPHILMPVAGVFPDLP